MEIAIYLMLVVFFFMIYDLVNAPAVDEDENLLFLDAENTEVTDFKYEKVRS
ncbi:hypothetical protein WG906_08670 [Pedobacter sp. P351]|uniref:hypothetical protein n=1 Tax=Pedobacter superstes TaxID=3133441 RepID=UPI0030B09DB9